ncbi:Dyp-type peroxidase [Rothia halotolerans]|uniref:Dyp-type peroxidase n=1 Tax=Rothia halotolerans TaxID=405770 RepID=UPI00101B8C6A|nr:Dyp-type peroxidase [Rothia halotolerans]
MTADRKGPGSGRKNLLTRRNALIGGATATAGAAAAVGIDTVRRGGLPGGGGNPQVEDASSTAPLAEARVGFHGERQAGVVTPAPAYGNFIAVDLREDVGRADLRRMLKVLSADAADLAEGLPPIADQEPELTEIPANLTVTVGFGERVFDVVDPSAKPGWLKPLPAFEQIDRLREEYSDGDLLLQICSDDRMTLAHAQRLLLKGLRGFGTVRWVQEGFRNASGSLKEGTTMRNLFGQVDGTINPTTEDSSMDDVVYGLMDGLEPWAPGGTSLVIRRIHMNLDTWDEADAPGREDAVGRKLSNGAPLTGEREEDPADLSATTPLGFHVIADYAHIRRATATTPQERILRRPYNYDLPVSAAGGLAGKGADSGGVSESGLIFASYQADPVKQFLPIQRRLAELDMLNMWTVPIGSCVFAIPPGCSPGGFVGDFLFEG